MAFWPPKPTQPYSGQRDEDIGTKIIRKEREKIAIENICDTKRHANAREDSPGPTLDTRMDYSERDGLTLGNERFNGNRGIRGPGDRKGIPKADIEAKKYYGQGESPVSGERGHQQVIILKLLQFRGKK